MKFGQFPKPVVFRHGDRTPDNYCSFFNPNLNETFWPEGFGALTLTGKLREYNIGTYLRRRYNSWLGDIYYPHIVFARTTDYERTKMSLQLVLASLFRPSPSQTWNWEINWQPIPYTYQSGKDTLMGYPFLCDNFSIEFAKAYNTKEAQNMIKPWRELLDLLFQNSAISSNPVINAYVFHSCLLTWDFTNIALPSWTETIYPEATENMALLAYKLNTFTPLLIKLSGGQLLGKIIDDGDKIAAGIFDPPTQKLSLYSGHEYNIAHLLRALKPNDSPPWPHYGSFFIFELHKIGNVFAFKIFFQNYKTADPLPIILPGCFELCPISKVKAILADSIPDESVEGMC